MIKKGKIPPYPNFANDSRMHTTNTHTWTYTHTHTWAPYDKFTTGRQRPDTFRGAGRAGAVLLLRFCEERSALTNRRCTGFLHRLVEDADDDAKGEQLPQRNHVVCDATSAHHISIHTHTHSFWHHSWLTDFDPLCGTTLLRWFCFTKFDKICVLRSTRQRADTADGLNSSTFATTTNNNNNVHTLWSLASTRAFATSEPYGGNRRNVSAGAHTNARYAVCASLRSLRSGVLVFCLGRDGPESELGFR